MIILVFMIIIALIFSYKSIFDSVNKGITNVYGNKELRHEIANELRGCDGDCYDPNNYKAHER